MDLLTVPVVDMGTEARPMTLEEMEDVGKRYRERKRQSKVPLPTGEGQSLVTGWAQVQIPPPAPCTTFQLGELLGTGFLVSLSPLP